MIRILLDPSSLDPAQREWWLKWSDKAEAATATVIDAFEQWLAGRTITPFHFEFDNEIWKELKNWLLRNVFYKKCAYCERIISGYYGDAEHYRPKSAVKHKTSAGKFERPECDIPDPTGAVALRQPHPGYFWLAYDWRNLIPSCTYCNSGQGKNERFDIQNEYVVLVRLEQAEVDALPAIAKPRQSTRWPGYYYLAPVGLDAREFPFLINPLNAPDARDPRKHIRFGVRGTVAAIDGSILGATTIETFRLKDEDLRIDRQDAQELFRDRFYDAMRRFDPGTTGETEAKRLLREYQQGKYPFSAAALDYHRILQDAEKRIID